MISEVVLFVSSCIIQLRIVTLCHLKWTFWIWAWRNSGLNVHSGLWRLDNFEYASLHNQQLFMMLIILSPMSEHSISLEIYIYFDYFALQNNNNELWTINNELLSFSRMISITCVTFGIHTSLWLISDNTLYKKQNFLLRIFSMNVTKSAVSAVFCAMIMIGAEKTGKIWCLAFHCSLLGYV